MNCNCNNNYYVDENGQRHTDIPMGTSPQAAYARTNLLLKDKVDKLEHEMADVQEALTQTEENVSSQLEETMNTLSEKLEETSDRIQASVTSSLSGINARVDNIITHNNDTAGNSELVDIRTGADGSVYDSAGTAVRRQTGALQRDIGGFIYTLTATSDNNTAVSCDIPGGQFNEGSVVYAKHLSMTGGRAESVCLFGLLSRMEQAE